MTKLGRFLLLLVFFVGAWFALMGVADKNTLLYKCFLCPLPFWGVVAFGVYSASTVLYRTFTFNDCPEAAKELLEQIDDARTDLRKKGMKSLDKDD